MNPDQKLETPKKNHKQILLEWVKTIFIALIIAVPIRVFIAGPFIVSGASMDPTFSSGQFLIVDRLSYRFEKPERGDVLIFKYPNNHNLNYIKRVIGLPEETIKIDKGIITIINKEHPEGFKLNESYVAKSHISNETISTTLRPNNYFVMGDNRRESSDSRDWGEVNEELVVGRPFIRLFPINKIGLFPGENKSNP